MLPVLSFGATKEMNESDDVKPDETPSPPPPADSFPVQQVWLKSYLVVLGRTDDVTACAKQADASVKFFVQRFSDE